MEKAGTGIRRVRDACKDNGNDINFYFTDAFWLTIHSNENVVENVVENVPENRLNSIVELIKKDTNISMLDLSKKLGVNHKTIKRDIIKLKTLGILKRIGPAKTGHWQVTPKQ
jgi:ATP-dependent DNA helicase RecG